MPLHEKPKEVVMISSSKLPIPDSSAMMWLQNDSVRSRGGAIDQFWIRCVVNTPPTNGAVAL